MNDEEFGTIITRQRRGSSRLSIRMGTDGRLVLTHPPLVPSFVLRRFINSSREDIRSIVQEATPKTIFDHGSTIGKSHTVIVKYIQTTSPSITIDAQQLIVSLPLDADITAKDIQRLIRDQAIKLLRKQAKAYLSKRLKYLAEQYNHTYQRVRFSHAGSRWGSCSSNGTISLNIALMNLPHELIDYVILHELAHTKHMNHSKVFWQEVARMCPKYTLYKKQLHSYSPVI